MASYKIVKRQPNVVERKEEEALKHFKIPERKCVREKFDD